MELQPVLHKPYDKDHFIEMVMLSFTEDRIEYYSSGALKRKLSIIFCKEENQYCLLETNYNEDGSLLDMEKGYTFRRIYESKTVGYYKDNTKTSAI